MYFVFQAFYINVCATNSEIRTKPLWVLVLMPMMLLKWQQIVLMVDMHLIGGSLTKSAISYDWEESV